MSWWIAEGSAGEVHGGDRLPWAAVPPDNFAPLSSMRWQVHVYGETTVELVADAARSAAIPIIYLVIGYPPDQSTAGGEDSPNPRKELALCLMRERPELKGTLLTYGTWDFQIVEALAPMDGDLVITKARYSGFAGTPLDAVLRSRGIRYLLMAGIASNVCVESTLRDAYFHEYWPIMIEDATMPAGPPEIQRATVYNVTTFFGWVSSAKEVASALQDARRGTASPGSVPLPSASR